MRAALILALAAALAAGIGCSAPTQGIVTGAARVVPGAVAPDIAFNLPYGGQSTLNKTRLPVAIVAFTEPVNDNCCQLDPRVEFLALQLADLPVSVVQVTEPTPGCPYGPGSWLVCQQANTRILALSDSSNVAWIRFGRPQIGTTFLLDENGKIVATAMLDDLADLTAKAVTMGQRARSGNFPLTPADHVMNGY